MTDATNAEYVTVSTYTKKPVEIQAVQWDGTNTSKVIAWSGARHGMTDRKFLSIQTLEGAMTASLGDFIIRGVQGEFYPCKPDIFEATYTPATRPSDDVVDAVMGALGEHSIGETWGDDGVSFVGCDCGQWFGKAVDGGLARAEKHYAEAILSAVPKPRVSAEAVINAVSGSLGGSFSDALTDHIAEDVVARLRDAGIEVES